MDWNFQIDLLWDLWIVMFEQLLEDKLKSTQDWLDGYNIQNYIKFSQKSVMCIIFLRFHYILYQQFFSFRWKPFIF
jgi:hypothetical protein